MEIHVDDDGFVRAPAADCYRALTDVASWATLLPDTVVDAAGNDRFGLTLGPGRRPIRVDVEAGRWRHDVGFVLDCTGDLHGTAEFWLEPGWGGTVVHHLLHARTARASVATRASYRRWLRAGLWSLKDQLQRAERDAQGVALS
ncbi:MAG: hypothetical protein ACI970_000804 [Myxococcota bacterium]|jgi:hypothetical protein